MLDRAVGFFLFRAVGFKKSLTNNPEKKKNLVRKSFRATKSNQINYHFLTNIIGFL